MSFKARFDMEEEEYAADFSSYTPMTSPVMGSSRKSAAAATSYVSNLTMSSLKRLSPPSSPALMNSKRMISESQSTPVLAYKSNVSKMKELKLTFEDEVKKKGGIDEGDDTPDKPKAKAYVPDENLQKDDPDRMHGGVVRIDDSNELKDALMFGGDRPGSATAFRPGDMYAGQSNGAARPQSAHARRPPSASPSRPGSASGPKKKARSRAEQIGYKPNSRSRSARRLEEMMAHLREKREKERNRPPPRMTDQGIPVYMCDSDHKKKWDKEQAQREADWQKWETHCRRIRQDRTTLTTIPSKDNKLYVYDYRGFKILEEDYLAQRDKEARHKTMTTEKKVASHKKFTGAILNKTSTHVQKMRRLVKFRYEQVKWEVGCIPGSTFNEDGYGLKKEYNPYAAETLGSSMNASSRNILKFGNSHGNSASKFGNATTGKKHTSMRSAVPDANLMVLPSRCFRNYALYNELEANELIFTIEHCCKCHLHKFETRHNEQQYLDMAHQYRRFLIEECAHFPIKVSVFLKPIRNVDPYENCKFHHNLDYSQVIQGVPGASGGNAECFSHLDLLEKIRFETRSNRNGAFEIQVAGKSSDNKPIKHILFSKLYRGCWPNKTKIKNMLRLLLKTIFPLELNPPASEDLYIENVDDLTKQGVLYDGTHLLDDAVPITVEMNPLFVPEDEKAQEKPEEKKEEGAGAGESKESEEELARIAVEEKERLEREEALRLQREAEEKAELQRQKEEDRAAWLLAKKMQYKARSLKWTDEIEAELITEEDERERRLAEEAEQTKEKEKEKEKEVTFETDNNNNPEGNEESKAGDTLTAEEVIAPKTIQQSMEEQIAAQIAAARLAMEAQLKETMESSLRSSLQSEIQLAREAMMAETRISMEKQQQESEELRLALLKEQQEKEDLQKQLAQLQASIREDPQFNINPNGGAIVESSGEEEASSMKIMLKEGEHARQEFLKSTNGTRNSFFTVHQKGSDSPISGDEAVNDLSVIGDESSKHHAAATKLQSLSRRMSAVKILTSKKKESSKKHEAATKLQTISRMVSAKKRVLGMMSSKEKQEQGEHSDDFYAATDIGANFLEGDEVEGNYRGRGNWLLGHISNIRPNRTYDIDYDDGTQEMGLTEDLIRVPPTITMFQKGDQIEGNYQGKGTWYSGNIIAVHAQSKEYDIKYDDDEMESNVSEQRVRFHRKVKVSKLALSTKNHVHKEEHAAATESMVLEKKGTVSSSEVEQMVSSMVDSSKSRNDQAHDDASYTSDYTYPEDDDGKEVVGKTILSNSVREMLGDDL